MIGKVDKKLEWFSVINQNTKAQALGGWHLLSVLGQQVYTFPRGTSLGAGETIHVYSGARAEEDAAKVDGLVWTTKNVWNNSKSDPAKLYDAQGELVDEYPRPR